MLRLDPTSLKLFVRVVEEGTIAAAADREHIAAAAVSKRLSEIESALRTPLLMRTNDQRLSAAPRCQPRRENSNAADKPCWTEAPPWMNGVRIW